MILKLGSYDVFCNDEVLRADLDYYLMQDTLVKERPYLLVGVVPPLDGHFREISEINSMYRGLEYIGQWKITIL